MRAGIPPAIGDTSRFSVENVWSVANNREPNWVLSDHLTGKSYRFFLLIDARAKMVRLSDKNLCGHSVHRRGRCSRHPKNT